MAPIVKGISLFTLILCVTSLSAIVYPIVSFSYWDKSSTITNEETFLAETHPLTGISDNVVICSSNGSELHEIYLCGVNDERLLSTNIPNLKQIVWAKLQEGSCAAPIHNCPSTSPTCTYIEQGTNTQFNVTEGGDYRIFVQYNDDSSERFYFKVFENGLNPSAVVSNIDCGSPGSIAINNVPSTYEYSITNGASWQDSNVFSITSVNTYNIQIRKKNETEGCIFNLNDIAVNNNAINASATLIPITCDASNGGIRITIADASSSYVYKLFQGGNLLNSSGPISDSNYTFSNLGTGTYDIEVTLASVSNCSWMATETVAPFQDSPPSATVTKNIDCSNGIVILSNTGGSGPYEYSLDNGNTYFPFTMADQTTVPILTSGSYTLKVRDVNGCEIDSNMVNVAVEDEIVYAISHTDIICNGVDNGRIVVDVTDTQGYSITYSLDATNFQTSNVFSNLAPDTYSVTIKKQKAGGSCDINAAPVTVNDSPAFNASAAVTQELDCTTGSATISASVITGGSAPFQYSLNGVDFQTGQDFTNLGAGDYTITVKDANLCTATVDQTVVNSADLSDLTFFTSNINCSTGATDVRIVVEGGQSPFSYRMTAPTVVANGPNDTFPALAPNTYTFEVTAGNGCVINRNFRVPRPIEFSANASVKSHVSCAALGATDGSIEVTMEHYDTAFNVIVVDGSGTNTGLGVLNSTTSPITITGLAADTYTIRIGDTSGPCEQIETVTIAEPATALSLDAFDVSPLNCGSPGSVTIEASGGWGNYTYQVVRPDGTTTPVENNKIITSLDQVGLHTIILTDINGCVIDDVTFDLTDQGGPISEVDQIASSYCYSSSSPGQLKIDVTDNGAAPYFYTVNDGSPKPVIGGTFTLSNLTPAVYNVKVKGSNGCETIVADTNISGQLFAFANITKPLGCGTPSDAIIDVKPENGYPPYTYEVDNGTGYVTTPMPFTTDIEGTYIFKITDTKGCEFYIGDPEVAAGTVNGTAQPVEIARSPDIVPAATSSPTLCGKEGTGSITLAASGGTPPFEYAFSTAPFDPMSNAPVFIDRTLYNNLNAVSYYYQVRDALGCVSAEQIEVVGAESAIEANIEKTDISCDPVAGGNIWGNIKVANIQNSTGLVTITLVRVQDPVAYAAGSDTRTWEYRRYENIDLATNSNYLNATSPYGPTTGFDIQMYWANDFVVRIEDDKGCFWESLIYHIDSPPIPSIVNSDPVDQTCANGATYDFSISNVDSDGDGTPDLVGPFDVRLYPFQLVDADGDGVEDDTTSGWRPFNDPSNPAWDGVAGTGGNPNERDYRFTNGEAFGYNKLLFGVAYNVAIRDNATGCIRTRPLQPVVQPPTGFITVDAVPQSETCRNAANGELEFTISNYAPGLVDYKIYLASNPTNTAFQQSGSATGTGAPLTITVQNLRRAWYVVEVEDSSDCQAGERFLIYTPKTVLKLSEDQVVQPTCYTGGQIAVNAIGGWDDESYFNTRNNLRQNWHPYEYALVLDSQTPMDTNFGPNNIWSNILPTAYDGTNNVYRAYVRDGGGCIVALPDAITLSEAPRPEIDAINVTNRCTSTNEIYNVETTLAKTGTNPIDVAPKYIWNGQVTSSSTFQLGPGNHTLEVRDENGCSVSQNIFIYPQMATPTANITQIEQCTPINSGEVTINVYGGSLDYTYEKLVGGTIVESHSTGDPDADIFTGLTHSVAYTFRVTDNLSGCGFKETTVTLDEPVLPEFVDQVVQHISCDGASNGIIRINQVTGSNNLDIPYEYSIDSGTYQTSNLFENLMPGSHTVTIRSSKNCVQTINAIMINTPPQLVLTASETSTFSCTSENMLGMATVEASTVNGGAPTGTSPFRYRFNNGSYSANNTFSFPYSLAAQTVTIDVIDANGCRAQTTVMIPAAIKIAAAINTTTNMSCAIDGVYEISLSTGVVNYSIAELPNDSKVATISGTTVTLDRGNPGNYIFEVMDNDTGCTDTVSITIPPFDTIEVSAEKVKDVSCLGGNDGTFKFTVSGYAGPFEYTLYNTDAPTVPIGTTASDDTVSGEITMTGIPFGTYYVEIQATATPHCIAQSNNFTIQSPVAALEFTYDDTQTLSCVPGRDAQITASPIGGWGEYQFELVDLANPSVPLQNFNSNNIFSNLDSGLTYRLTLRDSEGCSYSEDITIMPIDQIVIDPNTIATDDPSCSSYADGSITVFATRTNGPSSYEYILNNENTGISGLPQTNNTFTGLIAGEYSVTVIDGHGCDTTSEIRTLSNPTEIVVDAAITVEPSCTPNSGEITVSAVGGAGNYEYRMISPTLEGWRSDPVYTSLAANTYEFEARDVINLCVSPISVIRTINSVEPLVVTIDGSNANINCSGESDAVLVAAANGGLGGYTYELQDATGNVLVSAQDSGIFENLGDGDYRIRAISGPDCEDLSETITIEEPPLLLATLGTVEAVLCFDENIGSISVNASGGVAPYRYTISSEPLKTIDTNTFEDLAPGTYSVIVQDSKGCEIAIDGIVVDGPTAAFVAEVTDFRDEECSTDNNGYIEISLDGGTPPYFYSLGNVNGSYIEVSGPNHTFTDLNGDIFYEIYLRDANGCPQTLIQEIKVGVNLSATQETVFECSDGQPYAITTISLLDETVRDYYFALDAADPYVPTENDHTQENPVFERLSEGLHTISIVHQGGCIEVLDDISISPPEPLVLILNDGAINEILVSASGGDGNYTYYFEGMPQASGSYYINSDGLYTILVVDGRGCEAAIQVPMVYIDIEIPNFFTPNNDGINDVWRIKNNEAFPNMFVSIYDRYGRMLKQFIGSGEWNGSYNENDLPTGDYWYVIKMNGRDDEREFVGHFSIYR